VNRSKRLFVIVSGSKRLQFHLVQSLVFLLLFRRHRKTALPLLSRSPNNREFSTSLAYEGA
jgi:hypothetical protein